MPVQIANRQEVLEFGSDIQRLPEAGKLLLQNEALAAIVFRDLSDVRAALSDLDEDGPNYSSGLPWERVVEALPVHDLAKEFAKVWAKDPSRPKQLRPTFGTVGVRPYGIGPHIDFPHESPVSFSFRIDDKLDTKREFYVRRYPGYTTLDQNGDTTKYYNWINEKASQRARHKIYAGLVKIAQNPGDLIVFEPHSIHAAVIGNESRNSSEKTKVIIGSLILEYQSKPKSSIWRRIMRQTIT